MPSRTRGVVVEYALALAKEVPEGADLLLLFALRQLVDVLVAVLPVCRLDEDREMSGPSKLPVLAWQSDGGVALLRRPGR